MPNIPSAPRNVSIPSGNSMPNQSNVAGGFEQKENNFGKSVQKSKTIKQTTASIISSRADFVVYLKRSGLDLLTSAIEFQSNGDFIQSSYIIFVNHGGAKEPLRDFITRYPELESPLNIINEELKPLKNSF